MRIPPTLSPRISPTRSSSSPSLTSALLTPPWSSPRSLPMATSLLMASMMKSRKRQTSLTIGSTLTSPLKLTSPRRLSLRRAPSPSSAKKKRSGPLQRPPAPLPSARGFRMPSQGSFQLRRHLSLSLKAANSRANAWTRSTKLSLTPKIRAHLEWKLLRRSAMKLRLTSMTLIPMRRTVSSQLETALPRSRPHRPRELSSLR